MAVDKELQCTSNDKESWIRAVWYGLEHSSCADYDEEWDEITTAMAWITEELGVEFPKIDDIT